MAPAAEVMSAQRRHDSTSEPGWVSSYAMLRLCKASGDAPSEATRSPTQSEPSSCPSTPPTRCNSRPLATRLRNYNSVANAEMWKWLWLDFSAPVQAAVPRLIRKTMRRCSKSSASLDSFDLEGLDTITEEHIVGLSQRNSLLGEGSLGAAVFTLVSSAMGAGCLSLPFMLKNSGIISGLLMLGLGAVLAHLSLVVLMSCARYTDSESMAQLVALARGRGSGRIVDVVIAVYGISAVLCYLMFIGDFFLGIARSPLLDLNVSREMLIVSIAIMVVWPLSLPRRLSALRYVCVLSVLAIGLTALVVAWRAPSYAQLRSADGGADDQWKLVWWSSDPYAALQSFSIALFSFAAHTNAVPVATALKQADGGSIWRVSLYSVCIELFFYTLMGVAGYVSFGGYTEQDFILNYRNDDMLMFLVRCIYGLVVCLGAPINLSPAASSILGLLGSERRTPVRHFVVVTTIIASCVCVALWSEKVADVIGLIGASFGSLIVLAWPAMIYRRALYDLHPRRLANTIFYSLAFAASLGLTSFVVQTLRAWS
ncbi:slc38a7 [Symbiodinium natans]|uniref:Slc38a7 protein n=1 Tax=Symbiodinium natans TaxID=878477 RepID=A0A812R430_9DINO|nr:slc38a7 [Symbiodinium natans]